MEPKIKQQILQAPSQSHSFDIPVDATLNAETVSMDCTNRCNEIEQFSYIFICVIFITFSLQRIKVLHNSCKTVRTNNGYTLKLIFGLLLIFLSGTWAIHYYIYYANGLHPRHNWIARFYHLSPILCLLSSILLLIQSYFEHKFSLRPPTTIVLYLLASCLIDITVAWEFFFKSRNADGVVGYVFPAIMATKLALIFLENQSKERFLRHEYQYLSPEAYSGLLNQSFLWWLNPLFLSTYRGRLLLKDLFDLDDNLKSERLHRRMGICWKERRLPEGRFTFIIVMIRSLYHQLLLLLFPRLLLIAFIFAQPFLITAILELLYKPDDKNFRVERLELIFATGFIYMGISVLSLHSNHTLFRFITMFRGATISLIYDRSLLISEDGCDKSAAVSLMSNDVDQIAFCLEELNECWSRLIEVFVGIPLLTFQLGWVSIVPLLVVILSSLGSSIVTKMIGNRQANWSAATQKRISMTSEILMEIKAVKMMGLDTLVNKILQTERVRETKKMEQFTWVIVWMNVVANIPFMFAPAATFTVYVIQAYIQGSNSLDTVKAFTSLALITLVSYPASRLLSAVPNTARSIGCFDRIQEFLLRCEKNEAVSTTSNFTLQSTNNGDFYANQVSSAEQNCLVSFKDVDIGFLKSEDSRFHHIILKNVTFDIPKTSVTMIIGPVGAGKTTLVRTILGELPCLKGYINCLITRIGYCSQTPWIPYGTIRQVITGKDEEENLDEDWYNMVIRACELLPDITSLPNYDKTIVGSRGVTLSGGQKQRLALARAVYNRPTLLLLDDVFSPLDKTTQTSLFENLIGTNGILKKFEGTAILVTKNGDHLKYANSIIHVSATDGTAIYKTPSDIGNTELGSYTSGLSIDEQTPSLQSETSKDEEQIDLGSSDREIDDDAKDLDRNTGDWKIYSYYFRHIGVVPLLVFVLFAALNTFTGAFGSVWLKWWSEVHGQHMALYISIYFLLAVGYSVGIGGYAWSIAVLIGPSIGRKLHQVLLSVVLNAPLSFFAKTQIGTILNRFSQDMSLIELQLSTGLLATVTNLFRSLADAALIATGSYYMVITLPFTFLAIYYLQKFYLRTSRQLRILELESRSPIYAHFLETLEGLATIRGFGWQAAMTKENIRRLDMSQVPYYLMFCIQRWLALVLDLMVGGLAVIVVALATLLRYSTSPGLLGVSLNAILAFNGSISDFITGWTLLETSLGAIARLKELEEHVAPEPAPLNPQQPPQSWPSFGNLEMKEVSASYSGENVAIQNIDLGIQAGQHVAVCGRTGSGKSSLLSTILRILQPSSGSIIIDSILTSKIPLSTLRQRIITIPQDFVHIPGTMRLNLDLFTQASDDDINGVLKKIGLLEVLTSQGDLDSSFSPEKLSKGQKQLLAFARAMIQRQAQNTGLILLDEVTSSMDNETERRINGIIKSEFHGCTLIMVSHNVEMIMQMDIMVVMDTGKLVYFGKPDESKLQMGY